MKIPTYLIKGDLIYILSPAKSVEATHVEHAKETFEAWGFKVEISPNCTGRHAYFSGTDAERTSDLQIALDRSDIKAIVCARGGYGAVRIVDKLNWEQFEKTPKWLVGFSDITVFHHRIHQLGAMSIHATMPLNFQNNSSAALHTLRSAMIGEPFEITIPSSNANIKGATKGRLVGGNLSILYSLLGTKDCFDFDNTILFIEDLCEQYYHIDRMLFALKKAGVFHKINGLIIGGMTDLKDTSPSFGMSLKEIIFEKVERNDLVVCFDFPSGHIDDNRAMLLGANVKLEINEKESRLCYVY